MKILIVLLLISISYANTEENENPEFIVNALGECKEFTVIVQTLNPEKYDVKIEGDLQYLEGNTWKSSFFYYNEAVVNGFGEVKIRFENTDNNEINVKFRESGKKSVHTEIPLNIEQNCEEIPVQEESYLIQIFLTLVLSIVLIYYFYSK